MCIAIVKPKHADFPTMEQFKNCFTSNYHGAGFMYSDGENLIIKKGFMTFDDFKKAYLEENISKDKLVFFHFRIATHGLKDGGNTHPFAVVKNAEIMRETTLKFKGYGLIHNGILDYRDYEFDNYGGSKYVSDTMLFAMKLAERLSFKYKNASTLENAVASNLKSKSKELVDFIEDEIRYNKIAIMNEKEEYVKYGNWIEDNGVFYSNDDYNYSYNYNYNYNDDYYDAGWECCACCQEYYIENSMKETTSGFVCENCLAQFEIIPCQDCGILMFVDDIENSNLCSCCQSNYKNYTCDFCNNKLEKNQIYLTDKDDLLCKDCYSKELYKNQFISLK